MSAPNRRLRGSEDQNFETQGRPVSPLLHQQDFHPEYNDVVDLLNQKLLNYVRLNAKLRQSMFSRHRFIENTERAIVINLVELNEAYRARFIEPDFEEYCRKFVVLLKPLLLEFLAEIKFSGYTFKFKFWLNGKDYEELQSLFVPPAD